MKANVGSTSPSAERNALRADVFPARSWKEKIASLLGSVVVLLVELKIELHRIDADLQFVIDSNRSRYLYRSHRLVIREEECRHVRPTLSLLSSSPLRY
jgi:hypothetical protein